MNPSEVHAYLNSFLNFESQLHQLRPEDFNLSRIENFLDLAGNPAKDLRIIHVAGTKGKGSTCAFIASILQESGLRVGLYTSPHLHKINERIRIVRKNMPATQDHCPGAISDEELALVLSQIRPFAAAVQNEGRILTYFEFLTVAALCYFAKAAVDVVILETGLGGRLDATNAVDSLVAVITPVSLDHVNILGKTLKEIATEKAGIIKNSHQRVVISPQEKSVLDVILARCREFGIQPVIVLPEKYKDWKIGLKGRHQVVNAATAIEVVKILRTKNFKIDNNAIAEGIKNVQWPGRFQLLHSKPDVVVDCAHNEASARALVQTLEDEYPNRQVILVLGISKDKDVKAICHTLKESAARIILTKTHHPRAHVFNAAEVKEYFGDEPCDIIEPMTQAIEKAMQMAGPNDVILVTGSVFAVAEAISFFNSK